MIERHRWRKPSSGFTLLELLVVLGICALLMSVVPTLISSAIPGSELRVASRQLAASMRESRNRAIVTGEKIDVTFGYDPARYIVGKDEPHELPAGIIITTRSDLDLRPDFPLMQLGHLADDKFRLRFSSDGSSSGAIISLRRDSLAYTVTVDWLLGSVTMASGLPNDEI